MDKWIEAIANGDLQSILALVTTIMTGGFGTALVVVASKFLGYKKSVNDITKKVENVINEQIVPEMKDLQKEIKTEIIDEFKGDIKVLAESMALLTNDDPNSKIAIINNISKIGASKEVIEVATANVEAEVKAEEEHQQAIQETIQALEENKIETL